MKCKEPSAPPSGEVDWVATNCNGVEASVVVTSQTWYAAREEAARLLGTLPWNITCVLQSTVPKKKKKKKSREKSKSNGSPRRPV
jgi:hypothetical protein